MEYKNIHKAEQTTAILVDGGYFRERYKQRLLETDSIDPKKVADDLYSMSLDYLQPRDHLYRILYYDCPPFKQIIINPISEKEIDLYNSEQSMFVKSFFDELKKKRKIALRLGELSFSGQWLIKSHIAKSIFSGDRESTEIKENEIRPDIKQKGVDMMIGIDVASLALKRLVDKIILVSGDSDFVPVAKMARREGIDFLLDPMGNRIKDSLHEHVDGIATIQY